MKPIKSRIYSFRVIIEPDEDGGYYGFAPLLKGVHSQGETIEEIKKNLKEAIICHLQGLLKDKKDIPREEEALETIQLISAQELVLN